MSSVLSQGAFVACALGVAFSVPAQQFGNPAQQQPANASSANSSSELVRLRFASFDPVQGEPQMPESLQSTGGRLFLVQFAGTPTQAGRDGIANAGGQVHGYLPDNAYVVRMPQTAADVIRAMPQVRWVGHYHAAYRIDPELIDALESGDLGTTRYNMVVVDKQNDKPALAAKLQAIGGRIDDEHEGSLLFTATLTPAQLVQTANLDEVLWIDAWTPMEYDMDNARIQGGGNYVESQVGYTGTGVNAHIYEGVEATHPDFTGTVTNVNSGGAAASHGHATAGIVFGNGTSNPAVRGMAPDAGKFYTNNGSTNASRWQVVSNLINVHNVSHTTASWGNARTFFYTSISADADDIIFDHDIAWTQSQSNAGNQDSRPQAWAKNIFSIGGVRHNNNANPLDDSWSGSGSTGPAADLRIKPTLSAYYDGIGTSDLSGGAGYSSGNWTSGFGGTSGATPIVAGHNVIAIQMFTDDSGTPGVGPFGNALRSPGASSHVNRPHFTTLKCLQVASARQYAFNAASTDNRREHVGWGFPSLQTMWDDRGDTYVVDETKVLSQGAANRFDVVVSANEPSLRVVLHYAEPAANPSAAKTLINDLSVRVTAPNGTIYWGNNGLEQGNWSVAGGSADDTNPIECVFVQNPAAGTWSVDVIATSVVADNHVETGAVDADYGLVIVGGQTSEGTPPVFATFSKYGQGCPGSVPLPTYCVELNPNGGSLSGATRDNEYCYRVPNTGSIQIASFDLWTQSTGGTVTRPAHIYADNGGAPSPNPVASTTMQIGAAQGFYTATFATPVSVTGDFYVGMDSSSQNVVISTLTSGSGGVGFWRDAATPNWTQSGLVQNPSWRVSCAGGAQFAAPVLGNNGLPALGNSYDVTLADAVASSGAFLLTGLSDQSYMGTSLPAPIPGAPGCSVVAAPDSTQLIFTSAAGTASASFSVPNAASFVGIDFFHQWAVLDAVNAIGIVVSEGGRASIGN
ncbi:MAG: S8 family serine peptidase [bacterium]|nr:S8 family serine peptidase [bacterium]